MEGFEGSRAPGMASTTSSCPNLFASEEGKKIRARKFEKPGTGRAGENPSNTPNSGELRYEKILAGCDDFQR
jgi:hypothetical protein